MTSEHQAGRARCVLLTLATLLLGCGGVETKQVPLVRVAGTVKLNGEPLANAVIVFEAADASFSYAQTDERGRYDLRFDSSRRGVTIGPKTVRISMNRRIHGLNSNDEGSPEDRAGGSFQRQPPERIPEEYNVRSKLTANVTADTHTFDFDLHDSR
jgi:hypothetical protein